jgi:hypothetical protein
VVVSGFVYILDFPEITHQAKPGVMGMSYELKDAQIDNMQATIWTLNRVTFTGAAILRKDFAAYRNTNFELTEGSLNEKSTPSRQRNTELSDRVPLCADNTPDSVSSLWSA